MGVNYFASYTLLTRCLVHCRSDVSEAQLIETKLCTLLLSVERLLVGTTAAAVVVIAVIKYSVNAAR
jgi:hypothetical protein